MAQPFLVNDAKVLKGAIASPKDHLLHRAEPDQLLNPRPDSPQPAPRPHETPCLGGWWQALPHNPAIV
eukprot:5015515-Alexandrium_andersonii.AAC.1